MKSEIILKEIEKCNYWDMGVDELAISSYFDEVSISFFNEKNVTYKFSNCYKIISEHCMDFDKIGYDENGERNLPPYFLQNISIQEIEINSRILYKVVIDMHPLDIEIWCKDISVISN